MRAGSFPNVRMRRLRRTNLLRDMVREACLSLDDLILPVFVEEGIDAPVPIASMPGVFRIPENALFEEVKAIHADGIRAVMLFCVSHNKSKDGCDALREDGLPARVIKIIKAAVPEMLIISDVCFCEYTDHGHCGVLDKNGGVDNDATIENLALQAVNLARAGADVVAPSAMMDGQVFKIRQALDDAGFIDIPIMAYSSKFASAFYGPFRAAAGCELKGDRATYQMDCANVREALRESLLDEEEGADFLMVKPGLPCLDVLTKLRERTLLPLVAYQVSGEYAMIKFAAAAGAIDEKAVVMESLMALKRAGADIIISYFARDIARQGI